MTNRFYFQDIGDAAQAADAAIRSFLSLACGTPRLTVDGRILLALRQMNDDHALAFAARFGGEYDGREGPLLQPQALGTAFGTFEEQKGKLERRLAIVRQGTVPGRLDRETLSDETRFWPVARWEGVGASGRS